MSIGTLGRPVFGLALLFVLFGFQLVFFHVFLDATRRIHQFLLAREKGMAGRTDFHLDIPHCGPGLERMSARAAYRAIFILRVNAFFQNSVSR